MSRQRPGRRAATRRACSFRRPPGRPPMSRCSGYTCVARSMSRSLLMTSSHLDFSHVLLARLLCRKCRCEPLARVAATRRMAAARSLPCVFDPAIFPPRRRRSPSRVAAAACAKWRGEARAADAVVAKLIRSMLQSCWMGARGEAREQEGGYGFGDCIVSALGSRRRTLRDRLHPPSAANHRPGSPAAPAAGASR